MVRKVRKKGRADFRFRIEVTNISDYDIEDRVLVGEFVEYLSKTVF